MKSISCCKGKYNVFIAVIQNAYLRLLLNLSFLLLRMRLLKTTMDPLKIMTAIALPAATVVLGVRLFRLFTYKN